jgi:hypothetical protein
VSDAQYFIGIDQIIKHLTLKFGFRVKNIWKNQKESRYNEVTQRND